MDRHFTLRLKIGPNEVELSGEREDVISSLKDLPIVIDTVSKAFGEITPRSEPERLSESGRNAVKDESDLPSIAISPDTPCPEAIIALLGTEWGRANPRSMREIVEAMKVNAVHYPLGTIKGRLTDLTKKGVLRRVRVDGSYGYILIRGEQ